MSTFMPTVWSSIRPDVFDRQIDRILDEALRELGTGQHWVPACNAWQDPNGFYVEAALPGWEPKDISLEIDNQILKVKGERKVEATEPRKYHLREISDGQFVRLFELPTFVDHGKASASHKNGVLTITFPKREEAKSRRIAIEG